MKSTVPATLLLLPLFATGCSDTGHSASGVQAAAVAPPATTPTLATASTATTATSAGHADAMVAADRRRYVDAAHGFAIDYPAAMTVHAGFDRSYLANDDWKAFAGPASPGVPVVGLEVPGSNRVTAAEMRVGVSEAPAAIATCKALPDAARPDSRGEATIDGVRFVRFEAADAAMSHYLVVQAYRTVHDGRCYAIDLMVTGTRPEVYDPPATPPFSHDQAFAQLQRALRGFRFIQPSPTTQPAASASTVRR